MALGQAQVSQDQTRAIGLGGGPCSPSADVGIVSFNSTGFDSASFVPEFKPALPSRDTAKSWTYTFH